MGNHPDRSEEMLQRSYVPPIGQTVDPKELGFPQAPRIRRKKKASSQHVRQGELVSLEKISHRSDNLSDHLAGETGAQTGMDRTSLWPGLLSYTNPLLSLFKPEEPCGVTVSLCPSSQCGQTESFPHPSSPSNRSVEDQCKNWSC